MQVCVVFRTNDRRDGWILMGFREQRQISVRMICRPVTSDRIPRTIVSTSGSSGMLSPGMAVQVVFGRVECPHNQDHPSKPMAGCLQPSEPENAALLLE